MDHASWDWLVLVSLVGPPGWMDGGVDWLLLFLRVFNQVVLSPSARPQSLSLFIHARQLRRGRRGVHSDGMQVHRLCACEDSDGMRRLVESVSVSEECVLLRSSILWLIPFALL